MIRVFLAYHEPVWVEERSVCKDFIAVVWATAITKQVPNTQVPTYPLIEDSPESYVSTSRQKLYRRANIGVSTIVSSEWRISAMAWQSPSLAKCTTRTALTSNNHGLLVDDRHAFTRTIRMLPSRFLIGSQVSAVCHRQSCIRHFIRSIGRALSLKVEGPRTSIRRSLPPRLLSIMQANRSFCFLVCMISCYLPFVLDARTLHNGDISNNQGSQTLARVSCFSNAVDQNDRRITERDELFQLSEVYTARSDFVPSPHSLDPVGNARPPSVLWRRYNPFANLPGGGHMTWNAFAAITPSIVAANALTTLFTMLYNTVLDSWSRQPPRGTIQVGYGALTLSFSRRGQVIPWDFVADLARKMGNAVERGLLAFVQITFQFITAASIVFTISAIGLALRAATTPSSSRPRPRPPFLTFEIEE